MKKYWNAFCMNIKNIRMFQLDYYLSSISIPISIFISSLFWGKILHGNDQINFLSLLTYFLFLQVLQLGYSSAMYVTYELWNDINNGTIIVWLNRPIYYPFYIFSQKIAIFFIHMFSSILISIMLSFFIGYPLSISTIILGCISSIMGYIILFQIQFIIGCLTFWLKKVIALRDVIMNCLFLLGGIMLPIDLTPAWIQKISYVTPVPFIYFVPAKIFGDQFSNSQTVFHLTMQIVWILLFQLLIIILWQRGTSNKVDQGA